MIYFGGVIITLILGGLAIGFFWEDAENIYTKNGFYQFGVQEKLLTWIGAGLVVVFAALLWPAVVLFGIGALIRYVVKSRWS